MSDSPDFVVRAPDDDRVKLIVEAKTKSDASPQWAARMRRNLVQHGAIPSSVYFILALPDRFYFWRDARTAGTLPPDFEIESKQQLEPYLRAIKSAWSLRDLSEESFELLVRNWLEDFVKTDWTKATESNFKEWLLSSGLYESIRNGEVERGL